MKKASKYYLALITWVWFYLFVSDVSGHQVKFTLDFEAGDLRGWDQTGNAFYYQSTLGDNPTARHRGRPSGHSEHCLYTEIRINDIAVGKIEFVIAIALMLEGIILKIQDGRVREILTGSCSYKVRNLTEAIQ
ncbi:MAG: hypothetical protein E3K37_06675 [Candidatus Kuenenia sp.]|nr:hypothetical protein [Candidatus Kuenenia hertensis]